MTKGRAPTRECPACGSTQLIAHKFCQNCGTEMSAFKAVKDTIERLTDQFGPPETWEAQLAAAAAGAPADVADLRTEIARLEGQLNTAEQAKVDAETELAQVNTDLQMAQDALAKVPDADALADAQAEVQRLTTELATAEQAKTDALQAKADAETAQQTAEADLAQAKADLQTAQKELAKALQDNQALDGALSKAIHDKNQEINRLKIDVRDAETAQQTAEADLARAKADLQQARDKLAKVPDVDAIQAAHAQEIGDLQVAHQQALRVNNDEMARLGTELAMAQTELADVNDENTELKAKLAAAPKGAEITIEEEEPMGDKVTVRSALSAALEAAMNWVEGGDDKVKEPDGPMAPTWEEPKPAAAGQVTADEVKKDPAAMYEYAAEKGLDVTGGIDAVAQRVADHKNAAATQVTPDDVKQDIPAMYEYAAANSLDVTGGVDEVAKLVADHKNTASTQVTPEDVKQDIAAMYEYAVEHEIDVTGGADEVAQRVADHKNAAAAASPKKKARKKAAK